MQHSEDGVKKRQRQRQRVQGGWAAHPLPTHGDPGIKRVTHGQKLQDSPQEQGAGFSHTPPGRQGTSQLTSHQLDALGYPSQSSMVSEAPRKFSWVEPGLLCGLAFPDRRRDVQYLVDNNVHYLVNLTPFRSPPTLPDLEVIRIGIRDFSSPTLEQVQQFLDIVHKAKQEQKAVAVHCNMGMGRTGALLACFLVAHHNMAAAHAIQHIKKLRPGSVQTTTQEECIHLFEEHLKKGMLNCVSGSPPLSQHLEG